MIESSWVSRRIIEDTSIWQNYFLDPLRISYFMSEVGVKFWDSQIYHLWDLGWVRADFVKSKNRISLKDIDFIETASDNDFLFADNRPISTTKTIKDIPMRFALDVEPDVVPFFHPFKYYVFWRIQQHMQLAISHYQIMNPAKYAPLLENEIQVFFTWTQSLNAVEEINRWDEIVRLAIATEPCYYPEVIGTFTWPYPFTQEEQIGKTQALRLDLKEEYLKIGLPPIKNIIGELCVSAEQIEPNTTVHSLMRFMKGKIRKRLTGNLGGAILLKTMAEIIRRMAEYTFEVQLPEEDELGIGVWANEAKERVYGTSRIFDEEPLAIREILRSIGLYAEVRSHVYVEGSTEYVALSHLLKGAYNIDIFDLKGNFIQSGDLAFRKNLEMDDKNQIFSYIFLDGDVSRNVSVVRKAAEDDIFCGQFFVSVPDFELQNFSRSELTKIFWSQVDDHQKSKFDFASILDVTKEVISGKAFFNVINNMNSEFTHFGKGTHWGQLLAEYAAEFPTIEENGSLRPIITSVQTVLQSVNTNYRSCRKMYRVDPSTGMLIKR